MPPPALLRRGLRLPHPFLSQRNVGGAAILSTGGSLHQSSVFQLGDYLAGRTGPDTQLPSQFPLRNGAHLAEHDKHTLLAASPLVEGTHGMADIPQTNNQPAVDVFYKILCHAL